MMKYLGLLAVMALSSLNAFANDRVIQCEGAYMEKYYADSWGANIRKFKLVITDNNAVSYFYNEGFKPNFEEAPQQFIISEMNAGNSNFYYTASTNYYVYPYGDPNSSFSLSVVLSDTQTGKERNWQFRGCRHF